MTTLEAPLRRSAEAAGPAIAATFNKPERELTVEELRSFWRGTRMWAHQALVRLHRPPTQLVRLPRRRRQDVQELLPVAAQRPLPGKRGGHR